MASAYTLEFEKPLLELERQIDDLKRIGRERQIDIEGELQGLQGKLGRVVIVAQVGQADMPEF